MVAEGAGVVEFVLRKTAGAVGPVSVRLQTFDGTARGESLLSWQLWLVGPLGPACVWEGRSVSPEDDCATVCKQVLCISLLVS